MDNPESRYPSNTYATSSPKPGATPPLSNTPKFAPSSELGGVEPYNSPLPNPPTHSSYRHTQCATGVRFLTTIHGLLNIVIFISLLSVIISAAAADSGKAVDDNASKSLVKISAFHTRNAVLVFACFGFVLIILDTILYVTGLIYRLPPIADRLMIAVMLVLSVVFLILGCCSAAWEQKVRDASSATTGIISHVGAAASATFFLFMAMVATAIDFGLRLIGRPTQSYTP